MKSHVYYSHLLRKQCRRQCLSWQSTVHLGAHGIVGRSWIRYTFFYYCIRHEQLTLPVRCHLKEREREPNSRGWKGRKITSELSVHSPEWKMWEKSPGNASPPPSRPSGSPETNPPPHRDAGLGNAPPAEGDTRGHLWWVLLRHTSLALGSIFTKKFIPLVLNPLGPGPELSKTKE